jgi:hypothetical protein
LPPFKRFIPETRPLMELLPHLNMLFDKVDSCIF